MDDIGFTVLDLIKIDLKEHNSLNLQCIGGRKGLSKEITVPDLNRPIGALMGYYEDLASNRIQLFGRGESSYLRRLERNDDLQHVQTLFSYQMPCCIFTHGMFPGRRFYEIAEEAQCPILQTNLGTTDFSSRLLRVLAEIFAPHQSIHGVLVEVFGLGILLLGESGVGKSETALELIHRGHRLVADDVVDMHCVNGNMLMGKGTNRVIGHHMEIRGLGIINIPRMFGVRAIRDKIEVQLVVMLETWDSEKSYDRLGTDEQLMEFLGVGIPKLEIPVKPGRNIPIIIETAAMNEKLKSLGYNAAKEFKRSILKWNESDASRPAFFWHDNTF
ncbi:MAG: HPr(Ser) kinase/phosphatase [Treponema sp.]|nr:HPr(Ser) kinase/phosphatase [Treponema sp.]